MSKFKRDDIVTPKPGVTRCSGVLLEKEDTFVVIKMCRDSFIARKTMKRTLFTENKNPYTNQKAIFSFKFRNFELFSSTENEPFNFC